MAGRRKGEGIALLSMYADEDEEDADMEEEEEEQVGDEAMPDASASVEPEAASSAGVRENAAAAGDGGVSLGNAVQPVVGRARVSGLGIVDYAHDESAMSPEVEGRDEVEDGDVGIVHQLDVGNHGRLESRSPVAEVLEAECGREGGEGLESTEGLAAEGGENGDAGNEVQILASQVFDDFLPPPPTDKCSEELQSKFAKYLALKQSGRSFNEELRNSKGYRNPDFLQRAVRYQEIDQIGSCFKKDVFDPHGYDPGDYYDAIAAELKREQERKEQERKQSQRIDFVRGTVASVVASGMVDARSKSVVLMTGQKGLPAAVSSGFAGARAGVTSAVTVANVEVAGKTDGRSKKSKWDRVEQDTKVGSTLPAKDVAVASGATSAATLSNTAGSGYPAFWQQKRREAEEKPTSSDKSASKSSNRSNRTEKSGEGRRSFDQSNWSK